MTGEIRAVAESDWIGESNELNVVKEMYTAYINTMTRFRWSVLMTTMLSALMLLHMAMEKFSYQEDQLVGYFTIQPERQIKIGRLERVIAELRKKRDNTPSQGPAYEALSNEYRLKDEELAKLKYKDNLARNTLEDTSLKDRRLPLLGLPVPANDFLPVISVMLLIFMVAVLLNQWAIEAAVETIEEKVHKEERKRELGLLLPLHFAFNGLGKSVGNVFQALALSLPALSIFLAGLVDIIPAIDSVRASDPMAYVGNWDMILGRAGMIIGLLMIATVVSVASVHKAIRLDRRIKNFVKQVEVAEHPVDLEASTGG